MEARTQAPALAGEEWRATRDALQGYAQVMSKVRSSCTPPLPHFAHLGLTITAQGISTGLVIVEGVAFELALDLVSHQASLTTADGPAWAAPLGATEGQFADTVLGALRDAGVSNEIDLSSYGGSDRPAYDPGSARRYVGACLVIEGAFALLEVAHARTAALPAARFGAATLWAHHFDLARLWFSGRLVPDQDPMNADYADEQMNYGFSGGDETITEPYLYVTAYPEPEGWKGVALPDDAYWHEEGFRAAILPYAALVAAESPVARGANFLDAAHVAGSDLLAR